MKIHLSRAVLATSAAVQGSNSNIRNPVADQPIANRAAESKVDYSAAATDSFQREAAVDQ